jgi:hypothetical protein
MLTAFFTNAKAVLGAAAGISVAIFYFIFKARGKEIEELKEEKEVLEQEKKFNKVLEDTSESIKQGYDEEELEIERHYDDKKSIVHKTTNKPLSPTLLSKLRESQGLPDDTTNTSK